MRSRVRKDRLAFLLWTLLILFVFRVVGQLLVVIGWGWFLPPMNQWYSGLLLYRYLLPVQLVIIIVYGKVCLSFTRGHGFLVAPRRRLGRTLLLFGALYLAGMLARYAVTMITYPERRWTGGSIPIFFHLVLSAFILALGRYHYLNGPGADLPPAWRAGRAACPPTIITS